MGFPEGRSLLDPQNRVLMKISQLVGLLPGALRLFQIVATLDVVVPTLVPRLPKRSARARSLEPAGPAGPENALPAA